MKKLVALFLLLIVLPIIVLADVDLSVMSFEELINLRDRINLAIWQSDNWQEVTVPQGVWQVGVDIPAGHWTIKAAAGANCFVKYGSALDETGKDFNYRDQDFYEYLTSESYSYYDANKDLTQVDVEAENGHYFIIDSGSALFMPYTGKQSLGFSKSGVTFAKPTATPVPVINGYPALDFIKLSRNPENYIDSKAFSVGKVIQVIGSREDGYDLRFAIDGDSNKMIYLVIFPGDAMPTSNILDNDELEVFLTLKGEHSYETVLGSTITLPLAFVDSLKNLSE